MRVIILSILAVSLLGADAPDPADTKKEVERLQGTWMMASMVLTRMPISPRETETARLVISGDRFAATFGGQTFVSTFRLDLTKNPKQIDFTYQDGPQRGQTIRGIYELEGDTFRMSRGVRSEDERPTKFGTPPDVAPVLVVWKRIKRAGEKKEDVRRAADDAKAQAIKPELEKFEGTWRYASMEAEGAPLPEAAFKDARLVLRGDQFTLTNPMGTNRGTYRLDPTQTPKLIDVEFTEGPEKGKTVLGIYELEGDTCRVCRGQAGKPRPTEFVSKAGSGYLLEVLKRQKP